MDQRLTLDSTPLQWITSSRAAEMACPAVPPLPCVTWKCSVLSLQGLFVTQPFHMQMLCLWFLLIRHFTLAVDQAMCTWGLFRCNCFSGPNCPGLFLLLEAPVCGSKHLMRVSALFQVGVLTAHRLSSNCLSRNFYGQSVGKRAQLSLKQSI